MPLSDLPLEQLRAHTSTVTPPDDFHSFWDATLEEARMFPLDAIFEPAEQYSRNMSSRPTTPSLNVAGKPDPAMKPGPHQTLSGRNSNNTSSCAGSPLIPATAPTQPPVFTNTSASNAASCRWTMHNPGAWRT
ncbi:hypothetical protein QFZ30_002137 [Arthrobacter pascens]|nr:hypothetical protein [Arthrobacter pascens]